MSGHLRERDKEQQQHMHSETIQNFTTLLIDLIRMPNTNWREAKKSLKKDHRWDMVESLEVSKLIYQLLQSLLMFIL